MSNPEMIKSFVAGSGGVDQYTIVKFGAADGEVVKAAAATDGVLGVCIQPGTTAQGVRADVALAGIVEVKAGGTITRGGPVTSDASGYAVAAAPSTGVNNRILGFAYESAVSGDIFRVRLAVGVMQG